jgi:hypothetical protein
LKSRGSGGQSAIMKPKQLANVLIKILGLSVIAHGIPSLVNGLFALLQITTDNSMYARNYRFGQIVAFELIPLAIGIGLILGSRWLVEILFKDEAE